MPRNILASSRVVPILLGVLALTVPIVPLLGDETPPALLILEHSEGKKKIKTPIPAQAGPALSPLRGKPLSKVTVLRGSTVKTAAQPFDVMVELYRGASVGGELLCTVKIRYFRDRDGDLIPHYQLYREPLVFRNPNGGWVPIEPACSSPTSVLQKNTAAANAEGFYPSFEFGLTNGPLQIDSWIVR